MSDENEILKYGTIVVRDCAKQEYFRVLQLIGMAEDLISESADPSRDLDDYISILHCERKDLAHMLHFCDEIASSLTSPGIIMRKEEKEELDGSDF